MAGALKDSKTRWLGQIPTDWDMVRVKDCFDRKNKKANQKNPIVLSLARSGVKIRDITSNEGQLAADYTNYNPVAKDDILINPMDLVSGDNCNISKIEGVISPAYVNLRYKKGINPRFYNYYFKLQYWLGAFFAHGYGVSFDNRWTLSYETLSKYPIVLPPSEEQDKIADFLDEKCAEIDKLSEDIQKQIDILNNYKKSVITRAVTKGLDPNAEMKDSGIEWIGTIPKSWSLIRLKNAAWLKGRIGWQGLRADEFKDDESLPYLITGTDFYNGIVNWDTCVHITEERFNQDRNIQIKEDDLLITKDGTIGKVAIAKKCPQRVSLNSGIFIIRNIGKYKYYSRFMYYVLQSDEFIEWYSVANAGNSTILHLNQEKFYNFVFALPDIESQKYIAERLDVKCAHIDYSISEKYDQLSKLDSYKKSIIYEYVTGKKRVKGVL
jgi:Restriction endonuclease S subunits